MNTYTKEAKNYILFDYISSLLAEKKITQGQLAKIYGGSQATVNRVIRYGALDTTATILAKYRETKSYAQNYLGDILLPDNVAKLIVVYAFYFMYQSYDIYKKQLIEYGIYDFALQLRDTRANKYAI